MREALVVARMTFIEARRNRISSTVLVFCLIIVLASNVFQEVTISSFDRIVRDMAFGAMQVFGTFLSIFLGVNAVNREIDRKNVYSLLSKPISRANYLLGKILGLWVAVTASLALMLIAFCIQNAVSGGPFGLIIWETWALMMVEMLLLSSFSVMSGTFTSPVISTMMAASLFVVGHASRELYFFTARSASKSVAMGGKVLFFLLPDLERLNLKTSASLMHAETLSSVGMGAIYGLGYAVLFFAVGVGVFSRKDLK